MIDYNYLIPIVSFALKQRIVLHGGRALSRKNFYIQICSDLWPMLEWNYLQNDIGFNPKKIKKISDRKARRACYQSFALYKKSFNPRVIEIPIVKPIDKIILSKDSLKRIIDGLGEFTCAWDLAKTV